MSKIRADSYVDKLGTGAPTFPNGVNVTGVATATTFDGNATGLSGTPNITVNNVTSSNINSSGIVTATSFVGSGSQLTGISAGLSTSRVSSIAFFFGY